MKKWDKMYLPCFLRTFYLSPKFPIIQYPIALTLINALLFFLIALVYSSAGFGGGSMYLALLSQYSYPAEFVRFGGLCCNAIVTGNGAYNFSKGKWIAWKPMLKLLAFSVPACVAASWIKLPTDVYYIILGFCLLIAGIMLSFKSNKAVEVTHEIKNKPWLYPISLIIGFLAGLTGIGGGVYLSPVLHHTSWGSPKHIAAASSFFILVNSIAGLTSHYFFYGFQWDNNLMLLFACVALGGFVGTRLTSNILSQKAVKYITAILIIFVAIRVLYKYL